MNIMGKKVAYFRKVDDVLGIFHTHLVAGFVGGFCTGLFATIEGCSAFGITNLGGAIEGNGVQVGIQVYGALFVIGWNIVWTSLICMFIKYVCRIPLRMSEEQLLVGDDAVHGEAAYVFGPTEIHEHLLAGHYVKRSDTGPGELGMGGVIEGQESHKAVAGHDNGIGGQEIKHD